MSNTLHASSARFDKKVEQSLRATGWEPGRTVSDDQLKQWVVVEWPTESGFHFQTRMFSAAFQILREFGGLRIEFRSDLSDTDLSGVDERMRASLNRPRYLTFDPLEAIAKTQAYNWPFAEWEADGSLYPIGCLLDGTTDDSAIAVDGRGRIILIEFDKLVGLNIDEALHNVINSVTFKEADVEQWKTREAADIFPMMRDRLGLK